MKTIKSLLLSLLAITLFTSCADEGPEIVGTVKADVSILSLTSNSANLRISCPNSNSDNLIAGGREFSLRSEYGDIVEGEYSYNTPSGGPYLVSFYNLRPQTTYSLIINGGNNTEFGDYCAFETTFSLKTPAEGDLSQLGKASLDVSYAFGGTTKIVIKYPSVLDIWDNDYGVRISTDPNFSNSREVTSSHSDNIYWTVSNDINSSEGTFYAYLTGLEPGVKYYVQAIGRFGILRSNDYYNSVYYELEGVKAIDCDPGYFIIPDTNDLPQLGTYIPDVREVTATLATIHFSYLRDLYGEDLDLLSWPGLNYVVEFSPNPDFSDSRSYIIKPSDFNYNATCTFTDLNPGTKYYVKLIGCFRKYNQNTGEFEYRTGYISQLDVPDLNYCFETQTSDDWATASFLNITGSSAVVNIEISNYSDYQFYPYSDSSITLYLSETENDLSNTKASTLRFSEFSNRYASFYAFNLKANTRYFVRVISYDGYGQTFTIVPKNNSFTTASADVDYIDLGLPSGNKWKATNLGAIDMITPGWYYNWNDANDAAKNVKGGWRLPSKADFDELSSYLKGSHSPYQGKNGLIFTADNGNFIFFVVGGYYPAYDNSIARKSAFFYWTSDTPYETEAIAFTSYGLSNYNTNARLNVRLVK